MKCVVIDDEPLAIDVIDSYIKQIGGMEIVAKCTNPLDAISILSKQKIDLVFLDIEMPNLSGIDLVKVVNNIPQFIFTTAYPQYALQGFELNATDYLVKPIPFHRFLTAISRAKEKYGLEQNTLPSAHFQEVSKKTFDDFIFVKSEYEKIKVNIDTIKYIQGLKDYIKIYSTSSDKAILTLSSFKDIMDKLPPSQFIRTHRSYIVNVNFIGALQRTKVIIGNIRIPIGETYKDEVMEKLGI